MKTLYQRLKDAGCNMTNHYSDLYVEITPVSSAIVESYKRENNLTGWGLGGPFTGTDGKRYYDLPLFFEPYWQTKKDSF